MARPAKEGIWNLRREATTNSISRRGARLRIMAKAIFAAGCFWGVEEAFRTLPGVLSTTVGYTGGHKEDPTYKDVCTSTTGHVEAVQIEYDPAVISYDQLLDVFWTSHDPTQADGQGVDIGPQYQSAVFCFTGEQLDAAEKSLKRFEESGKFKRPIATQIFDAQIFWPAEDYHQQYLLKRGAANCHIRR
jgi:peptide-methionine (S)-S-oxide reductase